MVMSVVAHRDKSGVAIKDIDGPTIEQPTSVVIDLTTGSAICLDKTRCRSVRSEFDVR
jgi:threonine dehydrogenase-like Zn-dependent dehydrogenase